MGAACWCSGHRGVGAGLVGAGVFSGTEGGLEGLLGSGASSCPTHTKQGPQGRWEQGDPLLSPQCIQWALSSPINRLPGVRGIELPDLCLAGLPLCLPPGLCGAKAWQAAGSRQPLRLPWRPVQAGPLSMLLPLPPSLPPSLCHALIRAGFLTGPTWLLLQEPSLALPSWCPTSSAAHPWVSQEA